MSSSSVVSRREDCQLFRSVHLHCDSVKTHEAVRAQNHLQMPSGLQSQPRNSSDCQDREVKCNWVQEVKINFQTGRKKNVKTVSGMFWDVCACVINAWGQWTWCSTNLLLISQGIRLNDVMVCGASPASSSFLRTQTQKCVLWRCDISTGSERTL